MAKTTINSDTQYQTLINGGELTPIADSPGGGGSIPSPDVFQSEYSKGIVNIIDQITSLPGKVADAANAVNDEIARIAQQGSAAAEENVRTQKIKGIGSNVANWLQTGNNWMYAIAGVVGAIVLIRRL